ncbi:MAG: MBL fold metallo-hydrolase [Verrucomicrobiota bacterium]|nr:MBL fold metallo-hydrolase [Verrucomicrobiota bacterium]
MHFTNLTGGNEIGSNCYLLEMSGVNILLDSGLHPKKDGKQALPRFDIPDADDLDYIFMSHCHMDHLGALPVAQRIFPSAEVYMTEPSAELSSIMLHNSCNIMMKERQRSGITDYPLFTHREIDRQEKSWRPLRMNRSWDLQRRGRNEVIQVTPLNAGHVLGSASFLFESGHERVLYSGDINLADQSLMKKADLSGVGPLDTLIIEGTRGLTDSSGENYREGEIQRLAQALNKILEKGGNVLLPCFALGKQQEVIGILQTLMTSGALPDYPVMIGGMGKQISLVYDLYREHETRLMDSFSIFEHFQPEIIPRDRTTWWKTDRPTIFAISAGMLTEMTPAYTAAEYFITQRDHAIFFVGYVDSETPGGILLKASKNKQPVILGEAGGKPQDILCHVDQFDFTAHAHRNDIMGLIKTLKPRNTILVHGDLRSLQWFEQELKANGLPSTLPENTKRLEF